MTDATKTSSTQAHVLLATQAPDAGTHGAGSPLAASDFRCHACSGTSFRIVVRGQTHSKANRTTHCRSGTYACTNRDHGRRLQVAECTTCHLRALYPAAPATDVEQAYTDVVDHDYSSIEPHRDVAFRQLTERMRHWCRPPGTLLDVGCYTGLFPLAAEDAGWSAYGIEPSRWAAERASRRHPGRITQGFLRDAAFPEASFDVMTSWDVIEHVTDPKRDLEHMKRLLRPGGTLFLSTMSSDAPIVRILRSRWPWYMEMHRFYFTPETLGALLRATGFTVRAVAPYPHATSLRYIFWKLEPHLGALARGGARLSEILGIADRTMNVDVRDFFLIVAERRPTPSPSNPF